MKSRITTYVLIAAVVAVWGFIAWKIFFAKPDNTPAAIQRAPDPKPEDEEDLRLLLDYKDPFLKDAITAKPSVPSAPKRQTKASAVPSKKPDPNRESPPVKYTGTIRTGGRVLYIFEHAGLQQMLSPGEELAGFRLAEAWPDSVKFSKNEEAFTVLFQK